MPGLLARIGIYVIVAAIAFDTGLHYFGKFEYHFPFYGTFSVFLVPFGFLLILGAVVAKLNARASARGTRLFPSVTQLSKDDPAEPEPEIVDTEKPELVRRPLWPLPSWVGASMILLGAAICAGGYYWRSTRTITAIDTQLSFVSGHSRTRDFYVNVSEATVHFDNDCSTQKPESLAKIQFKVVQDGKTVTQLEVPQSRSWVFHPKKAGYYSIDIQFPPGPNCLQNQTAGFLWVVADFNFYDSIYASLQWLALGLLPPGLVVLSCSLIQSKLARFEVSNTANPEGVRPPRWPLKSRFGSLSSFGPVYLSLLLPLTVLMMEVQAGLRPIGFRVHLLPASQTSMVEPATGTLTLRIDAKKRYYLNSKLIPQDELANDIARLAWPAPPVVYLYADPNLDYKDVIAAIDTLRGLRANVVLLTRQPRNSSR